MKHYPHHIGDFDKATRHLTRIERSVYRDLIDLYYDTEQRLTLDMAALCRRIIARTNEESTSVEQVLNEFFTKTETGWYHDRCEAEIEAYRANNSQRAQAGKASAEAKRLKRQQALNDTPTTVERPLNSVETNCNGAPTNQSTNQPINQEPMVDVSPQAAAPRSKPSDIGTRLDRDWALPDDWRQWAESERPGIDALKVSERFKDFWISKPGKDGRKSDWKATWRNWVRDQRQNTQQSGNYNTNRYAGAAAAIFEDATHV